MNVPRPFLAALPALGLFAASPAIGADVDPVDKPTEASLEFFEKRVRPLLVDNCFNCHSANTNAKGGLRVDDRNGLLSGGGRGAAIVPGKPDESLLIQAVKHTDDLKMPPGKQLTPEQIADLETWIADGAAWPAVELPIEAGASTADYERLKKEHWAWQPLKEAAVPTVLNAAWPRDDVDRFLLSKLEEQNLAPVNDASKATLIRRITFDLTGLPPTVAEVDAYLADDSPSAFDTVVDRLLQSTAFGERWGRHWLDVARYAESTGSSRNVPYPHAWRYRDYVVDAFNSDKPFDQFIREQVAGDLLPAANDDEKKENIVATGFLALGVKDVNQRFKVRFTMDNIDEQIDTVSRSVLGVTASCARCHDHKFDPIPTADYYALAGIFHSTDLCAGVRSRMGGGGLDYYDTALLIPIGEAKEPPADHAEKVAAATKTFEEAKARFEELRKSPEGDEKAPNGRPKRQVARNRMNRAQQELNALTDPTATSDVAFGARDSKTVGDTEIRIRGEAEKLGPKAPRGFLTVLDVPDASPVNTAQSGRLELAAWLASEKNPLTQRVIVNRVWQHLFGEGLVKTVDNFGVTGDTPSHPELLDHLAARFVREGWSVKKLIRQLVLTRAYQLDSSTAESALAIDPQNRLQWRHSSRRLEAEEIRDGLLAVAGRLDPSRPQGSPAKDLKVMELRNNGPEARRLSELWRGSQHRSLYLPLLRGLVPTALEVFDFAEQGMVTGSRDTTTVPTQSLYLLNDPFVRGESLALAERVLKDETDDENRIRLTYRTILGRSPTSYEITRATQYLADYELAASTAEDSQTPEESAEPNAVVAVSDSGAEAATSEAGAEEAAGKKKKPAEPVNPDEADQSDAPVKEELVRANDPRTAAWASFVQAVYGSAEFLYLQ